MRGVPGWGYVLGGDFIVRGPNPFLTSLEKTLLAFQPLDFPLQMAYYEVTNINMADSAL